MDKTLILLKPDCVGGGHCGDVISRFERVGLDIIACKMIQLNDKLLAEHYAHVADKPFYPQIREFMESTPVLAMVLQGENVIQRVREMLGPTDSTKAPPGTIRGDLGKNITVNIAHASDSPEAAAVEIRRFFRSEELFAR
jgi:nucleoside-diphosphate kinase